MGLCSPFDEIIPSELNTMHPLLQAISHDGNKCRAALRLCMAANNAGPVCKTPARFIEWQGAGILPGTTGIIEKAKKEKPYRANIVNDLCQMGRSGYGSICAQGMQCTEPYDPGQLLSALPPGGSLQTAFRRPQNWPHPDSRSLLRTVAFPGARPLHRIPFQ